jgi:GxxExxY protein
LINNSIEKIGSRLIGAAIKVHKELGPGLLEKVYEICLAHELTKCGLTVVRQLVVPVKYDGLLFEEGFRLDLLIEDVIVVEIKAVDAINPVWKAQIISHLKLTGKELGYLINFNVPQMKLGINRFVNTKDYTRK